MVLREQNFLITFLGFFNPITMIIGIVVAIDHNVGLLQYWLQCKVQGISYLYKDYDDSEKVSNLVNLLRSQSSPQFFKGIDRDRMLNNSGELVKIKVESNFSLKNFWKAKYMIIEDCGVDPSEYDTLDIDSPKYPINVNSVRNELSENNYELAVLLIVEMQIANLFLPKSLKFHLEDGILRDQLIKVYNLNRRSYSDEKISQTLLLIKEPSIEKIESSSHSWIIRRKWWFTALEICEKHHFPKEIIEDIEKTILDIERRRKFITN